MTEVKGLTYPAQLHEDILHEVPLNGTSKVLEIGIGMGQATMPFLDTGCLLTAVDPDERMTAVCEKVFGENSRFSVFTSRFEDFEDENDTFDLIYSASAFHEVEQEAGYTKAFALLKSGGTFVRFSNHSMRAIARPNLSAALQKLYSIYLPRTGTPRPYKEAQAQKRAEIALKYGFTDIACKRYYQTRVYTTEEFLDYLATDADHLEMSETKRTAFFNEIRKTLVRYGGSVTLYDTIDLQIAKKP
ncbi:MAG: class I SAM-dependent methyltransferase [Clostridia bacterium]|nr:class I SAM-dependent methyltransferase [Clostridia bacterium]